jgi:hypothetical protein
LIRTWADSSPVALFIQSDRHLYCQFHQYPLPTTSLQSKASDNGTLQADLA